MRAGHPLVTSGSGPAAVEAGRSRLSGNQPRPVLVPAARPARLRPADLTSATPATRVTRAAADPDHRRPVS